MSFKIFSAFKVSYPIEGLLLSGHCVSVLISESDAIRACGVWCNAPTLLHAIRAPSCINRQDA